MEELISQFVGVRQQLRGDKTALRKKKNTRTHTLRDPEKKEKKEEVKVTEEDGCSGPIRRTVLHQ